jgi:hypothetical protein
MNYVKRGEGSRPGANACRDAAFTLYLAAHAGGVTGRPRRHKVGPYATRRSLAYFFPGPISFPRPAPNPADRSGPACPSCPGNLFLQDKKIKSILPF